MKSLFLNKKESQIIEFVCSLVRLFVYSLNSFVRLFIRTNNDVEMKYSLSMVQYGLHLRFGSILHFAFAFILLLQIQQFQDFDRSNTIYKNKQDCHEQNCGHLFASNCLSYDILWFKSTHFGNIFNIIDHDLILFRINTIGQSNDNCSKHNN